MSNSVLCCAGLGLTAASALATAAATQEAVCAAAPLSAVVPASGGPLMFSPRPRSEWELDPSKITMGRRLAVGGFGEVFMAKYEGTLVAVKRLLATDSGKCCQVFCFCRHLPFKIEPFTSLFFQFTSGFFP